MGKVGVFGSSYDPITSVHMWTVSTLLNQCNLDKIILLPCSNKRTDKNMNISDEHRWNMLQLAIEEDADELGRIVADDYEMKQEAWNIYTYQTMVYFKEKYPDDEVYFIMGADLLVDIGKGQWKMGEELVRENKFIVMARDGIDMLLTIAKSPLLRNNNDGSRFHLVEKGLLLGTSSTYIREEFAYGGEPKHLLPMSCYRYIKENGLYTKGNAAS